ncbi:MAG: M28 family peptidase [Candidatus Poseidoniales archaeon]
MRHAQMRCSSAPRGFMLAVLASVMLASTAPVSFASFEELEPSVVCSTIDELQFNGTHANASIAWQVGLGPRIPGSNASGEFRSTITADLESLGYEVSNKTHERYGMELTNLFARWPSNSSSDGQLVLSAHYDSRNVADQDENESNQSLPVPGANDAASGVAVLLELARHIPHMNLEYDVVLFFNDAEDQQPKYTLGAEAWAENMTEDEINATHAFVLLDMVGDADLQLHDIAPGNATLKSRVVELGTSLGLVNGTTSCTGEAGLDVIRYETTVYVLDDHVHAHNLGIPAIDLMDTSFGAPKPYTFGSYWHTMEDTPDKVSAESLAKVGRLVELGLRTDAFVDINPTTDITDEGNTTSADQPDEGEASTPNRNTGLTIMAAVGLVGILGLLLVVEFNGKR